MNKTLVGGIAAIGLLVAGAANAVPCGSFGVAPSLNCRDGTGVQDSASLINTGSYFGANTWQLLDRVDRLGDGQNTDFWRVVGAAAGLPGGAFFLSAGIWNTYATLSVSLNGPGAQPIGSPADTPVVNWSLYQLVPGSDAYGWIYGATRTASPLRLSSITLYGVLREGVTRVTEPSTLTLLIIGAAGLIVMNYRRRSKVRL
jgi:hypothetical protein